MRLASKTLEALMRVIHLVRNGQILITHSLNSGEFRSERWIKGPLVPTSLRIDEDGKTFEVHLANGVGKNKKTPVHHVAFKHGEHTIIFKATEGVDPARPSWSYTLKIQERILEIAGCEECGAIFHVASEGGSLCSKCGKGVQSVS